MLTVGDAGGPGREDYEMNGHNKHPHVKVGAVNDQDNETDLFVREDVGLLVVLTVDESKAARVYAMKTYGELEVRLH
jgi:hypothetical protein